MDQMPEPRVQLTELLLDLLNGRLATLVAQLLAGLHARLVRRLLSSGDLRLDVLAGIADNAAVECSHRGVHSRRPALVEVDERGGLAVGDRARDVLEDAVGVV